jgi:hypothetical protein
MKITEKTREHLIILKHFISLNQLSVMISLKELIIKMESIINIINLMPKVYEQEELESDKRKFYLHYFTASSGFYISEKDLSNEQLQAYGFVCLNGDKQNAEFGYISILEIINAGAEIDLHFKPCLQTEILKEFKPKT